MVGFHPLHNVCIFFYSLCAAWDYLQRKSFPVPEIILYFKKSRNYCDCCSEPVKRPRKPGGVCHCEYAHPKQKISCIDCCNVNQAGCEHPDFVPENRCHICQQEYQNSKNAGIYAVCKSSSNYYSQCQLLNHIFPKFNLWRCAPFRHRRRRCQFCIWLVKLVNCVSYFANALALLIHCLCFYCNVKAD